MSRYIDTLRFITRSDIQTEEEQNMKLSEILEEARVRATIAETLSDLSDFIPDDRRFMLKISALDTEGGAMRTEVTLQVRERFAQTDAQAKILDKLRGDVATACQAANEALTELTTKQLNEWQAE